MAAGLTHDTARKSCVESLPGRGYGERLGAMERRKALFRITHSAVEADAPQIGVAIEFHRPILPTAWVIDWLNASYP